jgi:hypothetical protein
MSQPGGGGVNNNGGGGRGSVDDGGDTFDLHMAAASLEDRLLTRGRAR